MSALNTVSMIRVEMGNFINFDPLLRRRKAGADKAENEETSEQGLKAGTLWPTRPD